ncbi:class I SAM-dependent methyltransferase [Pseudonocardia acaciae]|uniref:class I SAM-dependent methyltransferase n=1 Tax=Pseudonocardia acaciae TaxID=551276 RepID=UPI00049190B7|nr:methyltransferase domain-containing protein [Pseudonocardia acaciae]
MSTPNSSAEHWTFIRAAIRRPQLIGAVAPSTRGLGEQLAAIVPQRGTPTVVELGPGTGPVSAIIRQRMPSGGRQLAVEIDMNMVDYLRRRHPWLTVLPGDAAALDTLLADADVRRVDAVVSGLPWSIFPLPRQERMLGSICQVLNPGGAFTTFGYLHARRMSGARRFHELLERRFEEVVVTRAVWSNLPPALVYVCRRAVPHA